MPPKVLIWPETQADFDRLVAKSKAKFLPLVEKLQLYELVGIGEACHVALDELRIAAAKEDVRRGYRPPGTSIGNRPD